MNESAELNRKEVGAIIAKRLGMKAAQCVRVIEEFENVIIESIKEDRNVKLAQFARFSKVPVAARRAYNPFTKENIEVSAGFKVRVQTLTKLKNAVL